MSMEDVVFVSATAAFFALGAAYVRFCDRIIGPDPVEQPGTEGAPADAHIAEGAR
jgi:hypothetical protein